MPDVAKFCCSHCSLKLPIMAFHHLDFQKARADIVRQTPSLLHVGSQFMSAETSVVYPKQLTELVDQIQDNTKGIGKVTKAAAAAVKKPSGM